MFNENQPRICVHVSLFNTAPWISCQWCEVGKMRMCQLLYGQGFLLLLQLMLLISCFLLRQHFSFLPCVSAPASIGDWLQCIGNEDCIWIYLVVMLFQIIRPCHIYNGSFPPENMVEPGFCSAVTPLKTKEKNAAAYCFFSSASQQEGKL